MAHVEQQKLTNRERWNEVSRLTETDRNGPERTHENTEMDFYGYGNGPERIPDFSGYRNGREQTSAHTKTNFNMVENVGWGTIEAILINIWMYRYVCSMYVCM